MRDSLRLGKIFGVPIGINWSLLVAVGVFAFGLSNNVFPNRAPGQDQSAYYVAGLITAVALLVTVLLHELAHAIAALQLGQRVDGITLSWMGGITRISSESAKPGQEAWIAFVGPLTSGVIGGVLIGLRELMLGWQVSNVVLTAVGWLAIINLALAIFNLIPASPLDGGRILHAGIWKITRNRYRASLVSSRAGIIFAILIVALGFYTMIIHRDPLDGFLVALLGFWMLASARDEEQGAATRRLLDGVMVYDVMRSVRSAPGWITTDQFIDHYVRDHPGAVWLLEEWNGGYGGIVSGDALQSAPQPWAAFRPLDVALPLSMAGPASPGDQLLAAMEAGEGHPLILAIENGFTVGAVLPADVRLYLQRRAQRGVGSLAT